MAVFLNWMVSAGDAASQLLGRFIPVRVDGKWQCYTSSSNESISGASWRWEKTHGWKARKVIDALAKAVTFGKDSDHCLTAFIADDHRAAEYREMVEAIRATYRQVG